MNNGIPYHEERNSYTVLNEVYFWTSTINHWYHLLKDDDFKQIIISSLQWLVKRELIKLYGYVIMPNHIHLLWEQVKMNGKELPKNSFEKFTAHQFAKCLSSAEGMPVEQYQVSALDRRLNFWQRDPLAIRIKNRSMATQKLNYIHNNPLQPHWRLCNEPAQYRFSSAAFYESNKDEFGICTHFMDVFG
jgi:putative transposase